MTTLVRTHLNPNGRHRHAPWLLRGTQETHTHTHTYTRAILHTARVLDFELIADLARQSRDFFAELVFGPGHGLLQPSI